MAATAAERLALAPRLAHRARPSVQVEGRDTRNAAPAAQVVHRTRGYSPGSSAGLHPSRWERIVAPHAGLPLRRTPRRGNSRAAQDCWRGGAHPCAAGAPTAGLTSRVAESARESAAKRQQLAPTPITWMTRVPAPVSAVHTARQARIDQPGCVIVATHALAPTPLPPPAVLEGHTGQGPAAPGVRCVNDPPLFAAGLYLQTPERIRALWMVMTGCVLV